MVGRDDRDQTVSTSTVQITIKRVSTKALSCAVQHHVATILTPNVDHRSDATSFVGNSS